ncbi:MAG: hypothetical protein LUF68_05860 [Clostridiales bacterium]|nr:hypothetical protein [Clostridiales bacterium]
MAGAKWTIDVSAIDRLASAMDAYGTGSGQIIQEYLGDEGYRRIAAHIPDLIHASGRNWKGKAASATKAAYTSVFDGYVSGLTLTVKSKTRYQYLYFPDDGSTTLHHAGNQQFMLRGAEDQTEAITNDLVTRLAAAFKEG